MDCRTRMKRKRLYSAGKSNMGSKWDEGTQWWHGAPFASLIICIESNSTNMRYNYELRSKLIETLHNFGQIGCKRCDEPATNHLFNPTCLSGSQWIGPMNMLFVAVHISIHIQIHIHTFARRRTINVYLCYVYCVLTAVYRIGSIKFT